LELRKYQQDAIEKLREKLKSGLRRVILQGCCGSGKTLIAAEMACNAVVKGKKVLFVVNRRDLVKQTVDKFQQYGLGGDTGIILAGEESDLKRPIQIASFQTYGRRLNLEELVYNEWFHRADLLIVDEAHVSNAKTYKHIIDLYSNRCVIGLTATPCRGDGTGLGETFEAIVECIPVGDLIEQGYLVPVEYYAPSAPDLERLKTVMGDYEKKELGNRVDKPKLIGDIFDNWKRIAGDRQTIIFAVNVKHSKHITGYFIRNGVQAEHIDAHTNDEDRLEIYKRFEMGETRVLSNVGICTEGSDLPWASCAVIARPTKSLGLWIQMGGRILRPYPGKEKALLLDHAGCVERHGFIEDPIDWSLDGKKPGARKREIRKKEKTIMICKECSFAFTGNICPQCGLEVKFYGKKIATIEAKLEKVKAKRKYTMDEKRKWYGMIEHERRRLGYAPGWTAHKFRSKMGIWPNAVKDSPVVEPDKEVKDWLTYQRIKWIKGKKEATG
jgi:superfamily II DNA or RNA helicase